MALANITDGVTGYAQDVQQIVDLINGNAGGGQPVNLTQLNNASSYALSVKNLDTTNGRAAQFLAPDGTVLLQVVKTGVTASPDGTAAAAVVTTSHTQTLTNKTLTSPTLTTPTITRGVWVKGADVASAASVTLGTDGNLFTITGTTAITSITAVAGMPVCLKFASAGCKVTNGSNLQLNGDYWSLVNSTLFLVCLDGTNWIEIGRSGNQTLRVGAYLNVAQSVSNDTDTTVTFDATDNELGDIASIRSGGNFTLPAGFWLCSAAVSFSADGDGNRQIWLDRNSAEYLHGNAMRANNSSNKATRAVLVGLVYSDGNDVFRLRGWHDGGSGVTFESGSERTNIKFWRLNP